MCIFFLRVLAKNKKKEGAMCVCACQVLVAIGLWVDDAAVFRGRNPESAMGDAKVIEVAQLRSSCTDDKCAKLKFAVALVFECKAISWISHVSRWMVEPREG